MLPSWCRSRRTQVIAGLVALAGVILTIWGCNTPPDHIDVHWHSRPDLLSPQLPNRQ